MCGAQFTYDSAQMSRTITEEKFVNLLYSALLCSALLYSTLLYSTLLYSTQMCHKESEAYTRF